MRRLVVFLALTSLLAGVLGVIAPAAQAGNDVGSFEIDGNQLDNSGAGEPIDWSTPPPNLTHFDDDSGQADDSFNQGAKELEPGGWVCATGSAPGKGDITQGDIAFRTFGGKQFIYVDFFRATTSGDVHLDYEFNQLATPNPACPQLAQRKDGDIAITFDTDVAKVNGKTQHVILVRAFSWKFANNSTTKGTFTELPVGSKGTTFDAATNQNDVDSPDRGNYGEAALNLTDTIGSVACGQFAKVHMNSRSSTSISSALQDRTAQKDADVGECPNSQLAKAVRNVTAGEQFTADGPTTTSASPGNTIEYRLTYKNTGEVAATNVVVTDTIAAKQTYVSGSCAPPAPQTCSVSGGILTWNIGTVAAGGSTSVTFRVTLDASFPAGPTTIKNIASVDTTEESPKSSNETTVTVTATPNSSLDKAVRNETTGGTFGNSAIAGPGDIIEYQLTFTNTGNVNLTNVTLTDTIAAKQTFLDCTGGCTQSGSTLTWNLGTVNVGAAATIVKFRVRLDASFPEGETLIHNTATSTSTQKDTPSDETTVTVNARVSSSLDKAVRNATTNGSFANTANASPGDVIEYQLTFTNTGNVPLTNVVISDTIQPKQTFLSCPAAPVPCSVSGNVVSWNLGTVGPLVQKVVTFKVTLDASFPAGPTLVKNTAVSTSTEKDTPSDETTVTVTAAPNLSVVKTGSATGEQISWTIAYSNTGNAPATGVTINDNIPAGTTFVSCTEPCTKNGSPVTSVSWSIGTVTAGGGGSVTLTVAVTGAAGCLICNVATIASPDQTGGSRNSNQSCVSVTPTPNPAGARAGGNATPALVQSSLLNLDLTLPQGNDGAGDHTSVDSFQAGPGTDTEENELLAVDVPPPPPGSVLHATVLRAATQSTVTETPARADDISSSSAANVSILDGLIPGVPAVVKATAVRGVASAEATGTSAHVSSLGSAIEGLEILGIPQAVAPGARVDLPAPLFGVGSYVAIYEQIKSVTTPTGSSGGTYDATLTTNMIRVHITGMVIVGAVEVVVGHATAHADFPQTTLCGPQAHQSVSGDAFMARLITDPSIAPLVVGGIEIPTSGGIENNSVNTIVVDPLLTSKAATTHVESSFSALNSTSQSYAEVKFLCLLDTPTGCTISARLVRAQANAVASALNRASNYVGTDFVGLKIGPQTISLPVPANTKIEVPGIGFVILNEQFCDNNGTLLLNCSDGTVPGHTGLTVRAIHVVLLDPAAGGPPGVDLIVAEAHADARFV
ncbi:MAG: choice-of-anchor P family protein [Actinomycetota bacterium]